MITSRPVKPRARRIALIVASVPELTSRTISIDGTASTISSASSFSASRRRAEAERPIDRGVHRRDDLRMLMPQDHRPPRADVVDVAIAIDVEQIRPRSPARNTIGSPPTPPNARAGLFTPPGMSCLAREKISWLRLRFMAGLLGSGEDNFGHCSKRWACQRCDVVVRSANERPSRSERRQKCQLSRAG